MAASGAGPPPLGAPTGPSGLSESPSGIVDPAQGGVMQPPLQQPESQLAVPDPMQMPSQPMQQGQPMQMQMQMPMQMQQQIPLQQDGMAQQPQMQQMLPQQMQQQMPPQQPGQQQPPQQPGQQPPQQPGQMPPQQPGQMPPQIGTLPQQPTDAAQQPQPGQAPQPAGALPQQPTDAAQQQQLQQLQLQQMQQMQQPQQVTQDGLQQQLQQQQQQLQLQQQLQQQQALGLMGAAAQTPGLPTALGLGGLPGFPGLGLPLAAQTAQLIAQAQAMQAAQAAAAQGLLGIPGAGGLGLQAGALAAPAVTPPNQEVNIQVNGLPLKWTDSEIATFFSQFGEVFSARALPVQPGKTTLSGIVRMAHAEAMWVFNNLSGNLETARTVGLSSAVTIAFVDEAGREIPKGAGRGSGIGPEVPLQTAEVEESDNLYVKGLPGECTDEMLTQIFNQYGTVTQTKVLPPKPLPDKGVLKTSGFVRMSSVEEAKRIIATLNGQIPNGLRAKVTIGFAGDGVPLVNKLAKKVAEGETLHHGIIRSYNLERRNGFIACEEVYKASGCEVYAHHNVLDRAHAGPGDSCIFFVYWKNEKPQAALPLVRIAADCGDGQKYALKGWYRGITDPELSSGGVESADLRTVFGKEVFVPKDIAEVINPGWVCFNARIDKEEIDGTTALKPVVVAMETCEETWKPEAADLSRSKEMWSLLTGKAMLGKGKMKGAPPVMQMPMCAGGKACSSKGGMLGFPSKGWKGAMASGYGKGSWKGKSGEDAASEKERWDRMMMNMMVVKGASKGKAQMSGMEADNLGSAGPMGGAPPGPVMWRKRPMEEGDGALMGDNNASGGDGWQDNKHLKLGGPDQQPPFIG